MITFRVKSHNSKIDECWRHIAKYWKESFYAKCKDDWVDIQRAIINENESNYVECSTIERCDCGTKWINKSYILCTPQRKVCGMCDNSYQPYLCNPNNRDLVLKYIDEKYYMLLF